jgi:hypothetical protein
MSTGRGAAVLIVLCAASVAPAGSLSRAPTGRAGGPEIWFAPAPGSLDLLQLFGSTAGWPRAFEKTDVVKFYQQHVLRTPPAIVGPNTYDALERRGVFRRIARTWRRRIALEVGAVKDFYCVQGARGTDEAIRGTIQAVEAVRDAGGEVGYLALDEPFLAGREPVCGGPDPRPTVDRLVRYMREVKAALPAIDIGLIEPYPAFGRHELAGFLGLLASRGVGPAFLHLDVDLNALRRRHDLTRDLRYVAENCARIGVAFGVIVWSGRSDTDAAYFDDALRLVRAVDAAFDWPAPDHLIVQSWAESPNGDRVTPSNLPETRHGSHTMLINRTVRMLKGLSRGRRTSGERE